MIEFQFSKEWDVTTPQQEYVKFTIASALRIARQLDIKVYLYHQQTIGNASIFDWTIDENDVGNTDQVFCCWPRDEDGDQYVQATAAALQHISCDLWRNGADHIA